MVKQIDNLQVVVQSQKMQQPDCEHHSKIAYQTKKVNSLEQKSALNHGVSHISDILSVKPVRDGQVYCIAKI